MPQNIDAHPLEFTGSGGEYFRVWVVNVLLSIVTLGIYTPWARRRTAQYFYSHTLVAGSPLEFTAQQRKMVMGFVLLMLITLAYNIAANTGQDAAVGVLLLTGAVLSPLIWGSAMRFRLGATRWRGLRLQFTGKRSTSPVGPCSRWRWCGLACSLACRSSRQSWPKSCRKSKKKPRGPRYLRSPRPWAPCCCWAWC
jgi:uncharacterized membrane protein YjgN (DUF898 family)